MPTASAQDVRSDMTATGSGESSSWTGTSGGQKWAIHHGSAPDVLKGFDSESVDCIVTSPPSLAEHGWVLRSAIIWHRTKALREFVRDRPWRTYEYVFMLARSRHYYFAKNKLPGKIEEDLWTIRAQPRSTGGLPTAPFPDELVKRCLRIGCPSSGVVLDPFVGSGTTVRVALDTGRSGIGTDLNGTFCQYAVRTLRERQ